MVDEERMGVQTQLTIVKSSNVISADCSALPTEMTPASPSSKMSLKTEEEKVKEWMLDEVMSEHVSQTSAKKVQSSMETSPVDA